MNRFCSRLLMVALLLCASAWAQETTGVISGTVKDPSGAVVPRAKVTLMDTEKNAVVRTGSSGSAGEFSFPQLPVGRYSITVEAPSFKKYVEGGIILNVNDKLTISPMLQIGLANGGRPCGGRTGIGGHTGCHG